MEISASLDGWSARGDSSWIEFTDPDGEVVGCPAELVVAYVLEAAKTVKADQARRRVPVKVARTAKIKPGHLELADLLQRGIVYDDPNHKLARAFPDKMRQDWANTIRLMIERDQRSPGEIRHVIGWLYTGQRGMGGGARFVVESASSLREKFDKLRAASGNVRSARPRGDEFTDVDQVLES